MGLLRHYLRGEIAELHKNGVRLRVIGDRGRLSPDIVTLIDNAEALTRDNARINLTIALSYGGRAEIVAAARRDRRGGGGRAARARGDRRGRASPAICSPPTCPIPTC